MCDADRRWEISWEEGYTPSGLSSVRLIVEPRALEGRRGRIESDFFHFLFFFLYKTRVSQRLLKRETGSGRAPEYMLGTHSRARRSTMRRPTRNHSHSFSRSSAAKGRDANSAD